jgi:hypothetical protein
LSGRAVGRTGKTGEAVEAQQWVEQGQQVRLFRHSSRYGRTGTIGQAIQKEP